MVLTEIAGASDSRPRAKAVAEPEETAPVEASGVVAETEEDEARVWLEAIVVRAGDGFVVETATEEALADDVIKGMLVVVGGGGGGEDDAGAPSGAVLNPAGSVPIQVYPTVLPPGPRIAMLSYMLCPSPVAVPDATNVSPLIGIVCNITPLPLPLG